MQEVIEVKKDKENADAVRALKLAWEEAEPGRAAKAKQSRLSYLSTHAVKVRFVNFFFFCLTSLLFLVNTVLYCFLNPVLPWSSLPSSVCVMWLCSVMRQMRMQQQQQAV